MSTFSSDFELCLWLASTIDVWFDWFSILNRFDRSEIDQTNMATANDEATFSRMFRNAVQFALGSKFSEIQELKRVQEESLYQFLKRRDVFSVLPTCYGKSLIFQLVPGVCSYLHDQGLNYPQHPVLIVMPVECFDCVSYSWVGTSWH